MRFRFRTAGSFYTQAGKELLEPFGFQFRSVETLHDEDDACFFLVEPDDDTKGPFIECATLADLLALHDQLGTALILTGSAESGYELELYDSYRE